MADEERYSVRVWDSDEFFAVLESFPPAQQERITDFMANHLAVRPRVMIPGVLKELKGNWSGVYQLECGGPRRLLYEVDDSGHAVTIIYLGHHPQWGKRRPLGGSA
jgi:mRNA-degrading endonuclease RelE of RelBE toxin-antitoxin system